MWRPARTMTIRLNGPLAMPPIAHPNVKPVAMRSRRRLAVNFDPVVYAAIKGEKPRDNNHDFAGVSCPKAREALREIGSVFPEHAALLEQRLMNLQRLLA